MPLKCKCYHANASLKVLTCKCDDARAQPSQRPLPRKLGLFSLKIQFSHASAAVFAFAFVIHARAFVSFLA
eukprot:2846585-Rhodomonas_salina.2